MSYLIEDSGELYSFITGKTSTALGRRLLRNLKKEGLDITIEQWSVLFLLWEKDGCTQQELCEGTFRDKPSITRLVDNLEKQTLVKRTPDTTDRRINLVYLTKEGKSIKRKSLNVARKTLEEALAGVSERQMKTCREVLSKVYENLQ
jgi:DNA-binding MarR family transcriptional regulator